MKGDGKNCVEEVQGKGGSLKKCNKINTAVISGQKNHNRMK